MRDNPQADLIASLYVAMDRHDGEAMVACYHKDVVFRDPAFGELHGEMARDMWRMLAKAGKDLRVEATNINASESRGSAHWEADYTFATKRKVHNVIDATFEFKDGLIIKHTDDFDFGRWAGQAFGLPGSILAKTPIMPFAIRQLTRRQLGAFHAKRKARANP